MESIQILNQRLIDKYGKYLDERAMFRLVYSEDTFEKRDVTHTRDGFQLLNPSVEEVKKYFWINNKYILEGLKETGILRGGKIEQIIDYEPLWVFEDGNGRPVPPVWPGIEHILESARCAQEGNNGREVDPDDALKDPKTMHEAKEQRLKEIQAALWPNETMVGDALAYKEAIVVPRNYTKEN
jgi:hypothetical protein